MINEQIKETNTLKAWVTGKLAMTCIGLGLAYCLYYSPLGQKLKAKFFGKKETEE